MIARMIPALNISAFVPYPKLLSISGATYPGDPHLKVSAIPGTTIVASPKSAIFSSALSSGLLLLV